MPWWRFLLWNAARRNPLGDRRRRSSPTSSARPRPTRSASTGSTAAIAVVVVIVLAFIGFTVFGRAMPNARDADAVCSSRARYRGGATVAAVFVADMHPGAVASAFRVRCAIIVNLEGGNYVARRTVLVCDNCGKEVGENKGAALRVTFTDARRGLEGRRSLRRLRRRRCPAAPLPAAAAGRSRVADRLSVAAAGRRRVERRGAGRRRRDRRGRSPLAAAFVSARAGRRRPGQVYDGPMGLSLVAGPANAGKVALLLERYLARLDDEPFLIVPNRSDVDRVERDLLAPLRLPARRRRSGRSTTCSSGSPPAIADARPVATRRAADAVARRAVAERVRAGDDAARALGALRRLRRRAARRRSPSSSPGCSTRTTSTASSPRSTRAYRARARPARALGPRPAPAPRRASGCSATSTPGTASPSSPTASRT